MKLPLIVKGRNYSQETVDDWSQVWETICKMAYEGKQTTSAILTTPSFMMVEESANDNLSEGEHSSYYRKKYPDNEYDITLDCTWKKYSRMYSHMKDPLINLGFERLHVPRPLFESLGIYPWFRYSFPNCKITFWEE